jgi:hypothetical protein
MEGWNKTEAPLGYPQSLTVNWLFSFVLEMFSQKQS